MESYSGSSLHDWFISLSTRGFSLSQLVGLPSRSRLVSALLCRQATRLLHLPAEGCLVTSTSVAAVKIVMQMCVQEAGEARLLETGRVWKASEGRWEMGRKEEEER